MVLILVFITNRQTVLQIQSMDSKVLRPSSIDSGTPTRSFKVEKWGSFIWTSRHNIVDDLFIGSTNFRH